MSWIRIAGAFAFVVSCAACTDDEPKADPPPPGWQTVTFDGVSFDVPADWPVKTSEDWFEFNCSASEDGVFLPPAEDEAGALCPATDEYGASVRVLPYDGERVEAGAGAVEEGAGADRRVVRSTPANRWHSVIFTERGVRFVFYEIDDATYDSIVASVEGSRA